ncbi:response regulator transcription factor [Clostridioides mangenotii]|uniref:response regulator transcription factor n=1 Tax=Metaclostridioides mangenotii TaxID=1540 RepID=UPI001C10D20D|nr:response regulator transcription factor [Clostridioides mangenotii]MBU5306516.1 response regulator transcription factor [Clostridioides mangenotii]
MKSILLLEDDENLNRGISLRLEKEGYKVHSNFGVREAIECFNSQDIDLIISDITLGDGNGIDFCRDIRKQSDVYIIFLTALNQEIDIVNGYDIGGDDYITKPFSLMVLMSKVNALMRRIDSPEKLNIVSEDIRVSYKDMKVFRNDDEIQLSKTELQLLIYLMENAKQIVSKELILSHVWDNEGLYVDDNTVSVNISRLRNKIGADNIQNVRGMGYIWVKGSTKE